MGPIIEPSLIQALYISDAVGVGKVFFSGIINISLITLTVVSVSLVAWSRWKDKIQQNDSTSAKS